MNSMPAAQRAIGQLIADGARLHRAAGVAALWVIIGLGLAGGFPAVAQEAETMGETNDVIAAEVLARINELVQAGEFNQPEDMAAPDDLVATNAPSRPTGPTQGESRSVQDSGSADSSRSPTDERRSRGRRSSRSRSVPSRSSSSAGDYGATDGRSQPAALPQTNGAPAGLDYSAFQVIVDRNIFDPNRYPRRSGETRARPAPKTVDSLTLVGTMSYERGTFAFFDGSSSDYRKALKLSDIIAGYEVCNITPDAVKLAAGTNVLELPVGMQLRREEDGPWRLADRSGPYAAAPASNTTNAATATASGTGSSETDSDIIKRLMQRREQE